jgi:hypothetical protein
MEVIDRGIPSFFTTYQKDLEVNLKADTDPEITWI